MPFDAAVLAEIQAKVDLLAYVSQYVSLKKRGREYVGLCPFHAERTPSFYLNAEKQMWHCYGCNAGGDLIKFAQRYETADFPTVVRMLAGRAGIELQESPALARRRTDREAIYEANAAAQSYFRANLSKHAAAGDYLRSRGIEAQSAEAFGVGYAPDVWEGLVGALRRAGVDLALAARAGLVRERGQGGGHFDFFRHRLMLPIYNLTGEILAFGGRALSAEEPKYLNTPNTAVYQKGQHVYGLHLARRAASADGALIVVEGYLDAIALHQAGFGNTVASLGTAFTVEQARELRRVAANLYLCFDGDAAGQSATVRSVDMLVEEGLSLRVVDLPRGTDPDAFVRREGAEAFAQRLNSALPWVDFKIDQACSRIASKFASKSDIAAEALKTIVQVRDPIERDQYVKSMARRLQVSEGALRLMRVPPAVPGAGGHSATAPRSAAAPLSIETELLRIVLARPALLAQATASVRAQDFDDERMADAFARLAAQQESIERGLNPLSLFSEDRSSSELTRLAFSSPHLTLEEDEQRLAAVLERFERRKRERRLSKVDEEMNRLLNLGAPVPAPLRDEYNDLAASLRRQV
jgi:DNA primase